jgi:hypothetical protein
MTTKKKHWVEVTLRAETTVRIEVEAADDEDPCDLLPNEERRAIGEASQFADWEVERVRLERD